MKTYIQLSIITVILFASKIGYAISIPNKCPSIDSLKSVGFDMVQAASAPRTWAVAKRQHTYDTNVSWTFYIGVEADNENDAMNKAVTSLKSLYLFSGPNGDNNRWSCIYLNDKNNLAIASSPAVNIDQISR